MKSYTRIEKEEALLLAEVVGPTKAGKQLGIPAPTICGWKRKDKETDKQIEAQETLSKKRQENGERVLMRLAQNIEQKQAKLADDLFGTAQLAQQKLDESLNSSTQTNEDATWMRAVVGALDYAIKNAQLLSGEATNRKESKHEYRHSTKELQSRIDRITAQAREREVLESAQ